MLMDFLYWQIGGDYSAKGILNYAGCNFAIMLATVTAWLFGSLLTFQLEREVFLREQANKLYSPVAYFMAKNTSDLFSGCIGPLIYMLIAFWGLGF